MGLTRTTPLRGVIIDLDGTLVDTAPDLTFALNGMRAELGLAPQTLASVTRMVGKGSEHLVRSSLVPELGDAGANAQLPHALNRYLALYRAINGQHSRLYAGVVGGIAQLRAMQLHLACVTNKPRALAIGLLEHFGLARQFEFIVGGDSQPQQKPHPAPLLAGCAGLGTTAGETVAIGDSSNDAQAAHAAGCKVLLVPYGYNHGRDVRDLQADGIVESLEDAAAWIAAFNRPLTLAT